MESFRSVYKMTKAAIFCLMVWFSNIFEYGKSPKPLNPPSQPYLSSLSIFNVYNYNGS